MTPSEFVKSDYDPVAEGRFFSSIVLANGSFKATCPNRLNDLNALSIPHIRAIDHRPLKIKDVACSSGVSTEEWYRALSTAGISTEVTGTDISVEALHLRGRFVEVLLDRKFNIIHANMAGTPVHPRILKALRAPVGCILRPFRKRLTPGTIRLVSRSVRNVRVEYGDLDDHECQRDRVFDVIRAANILNIAYFEGECLRRMTFDLLRELREMGLFIVCRTREDGSNHATLFRYEGFRLRVVERLGEGSELESILADVLI